MFAPPCARPLSSPSPARQVIGGGWHWRGNSVSDGRNVPGAPPPDVVFVGLQEVDMSPLCLVSPSGETERGTAWQQHLTLQLNKHVAADGDAYVLIAAAQLCTVAAFAFVRSVHLPFVSSPSARSCSIGVNLVVANVRNKAAIELRFGLRGVQLAFISAHFAAHEGHCEERCAPCHDRLAPHPPPLLNPTSAAYPSETKPTNQYKPKINRLFAFHTAIRNANYKQAVDYFLSSGNAATVFFCGDLNYRLSCGREHAYAPGSFPRVHL
jgi:hypothetical protein